MWKGVAKQIQMQDEPTTTTTEHGCDHDFEVEPPKPRTQRGVGKVGDLTDKRKV